MTHEMQNMLTATTFAVVGASRSAEKYGFLVYQALKAAGKTVFAVNPNADLVDGDLCYATLSDLPDVPEVVVMVVPPAVTEWNVEDCRQLGIQNIWMQPGAESEKAVTACVANGIAVVSGGPCIMVLIRSLAFQKSEINLG